MRSAKPAMQFRLPLRSIPGYELAGLRKQRHHGQGDRSETLMANEKGPNIKKRPKCKNCEGKGTLKKGDKVVKCQRCGGTGVR
jgi:DnaJ-class molecular chaperone